MVVLWKQVRLNDTFSDIVIDVFVALPNGFPSQIIMTYTSMTMSRKCVENFIGKPTIETKAHIRRIILLWADQWADDWKHALVGCWTFVVVGLGKSAPISAEASDNINLNIFCCTTLPAAVLRQSQNRWKFITTSMPMPGGYSPLTNAISDPLFVGTSSHTAVCYYLRRRKYSQTRKHLKLYNIAWWHRHRIVDKLQCARPGILMAVNFILTVIILKWELLIPICALPLNCCCHCDRKYVDWWARG